MFGRGKKPVSLAYKEKLLADIAYYEKRIEEALHKKKHNSFEDVVSSDEDCNPYTVNVGPFPMQLKREEARLSGCTSMTLELAMLTIMESEVNVMAAAPEVRSPVSEDGTWLEVAAECKIDLVSFTITFYAHKPHRKFAPTRFRSLRVSPTKPAHERELAQSVLAKLSRPNLALQVLQSYAAAFRSRRTTLLELAEKYADRLNMEAMPEGGYRVKFLDLLTVEWTLENMWSPVVPFCHRMKFELEYMPKHYIHAIGKLYKQFKDPSLETSERTHVLSKIFDICLEAQGPARDLHDTFESDPETAGRLHERRTTIDQEMEVPSQCDQNVQLSPQKLPKGKENKAHNRKTAMAPPKAIPKKAKKTANGNNKAKGVVDDENVSKSTKSNENASSDDATKSSYDSSATENRKAVKRAIENDGTGNAKKIRTDEKNTAKSSDKVTDIDIEKASGESNVSSKSNARKKDSKTVSKNMGDKETEVDPKSKKNADASKSADSNLNKRNEATSKNAAKKVGGDKSNGKPKDIEKEVASKNEAKEIRDDGSVATSKTSVKKSDAKAVNHVTSAKEQDTEGSVASSKNSKKRPDGKSVVSSKSVNEKNNFRGSSSNDLNKKVSNNKNQAPKNLKDKMSSASSKDKNTVERESNKHENTNVTEVVERNKVNNERKVQNDNNEREKPSKASTKVKVTVHKKTVDNNQVAKQDKPLETTDKSVKTKQSNDKVASKSTVVANKESLKDAMKNKVTNTKNTENKTNQNTVEANEKVASKSTAVANKESLKDAMKNKVTNTKNTENKTNQNTVEANEKVASKSTAVANKESLKDAMKNNVTNTKNTENKTNHKTVEANTQNINKNKESFVPKITKPNSEATKNMKNDINRKKATTVVEKSKTTVSKVSNAKDNEASTSKRNETVENNNLVAKVSNIINQNKDKADKLQNINPKTVPKITKPNVLKTNIRTVNPNIRKIQENQLKVAEKLKTRIPTMSNKLKLGTFGSNLGKTAAKYEKIIEKTKIPLKSLPVFKKIVRNPTRMSPRKLPSTIKPSSHGFSNK